MQVGSRALMLFVMRLRALFFNFLLFSIALQETKHLTEAQFGVTLALLGQSERRDILKDLYDDLAVSDGLAITGFLVALNRY